MDWLGQLYELLWWVARISLTLPYNQKFQNPTTKLSFNKIAFVPTWTWIKCSLHDDDDDDDNDDDNKNKKDDNDDNDDDDNDDDDDGVFSRRQKIQEFSQIICVLIRAKK